MQEAERFVPGLSCRAVNVPEFGFYTIIYLIGFCGLAGHLTAIYNAVWNLKCTFPTEINTLQRKF